MSTRLIALLSVLVFLGLTGCAHRHPEHRWIQYGFTQSEHDRDLAAARAEAWKAYPEWSRLPADRQSALKKKFPKRNDAELEEELAKMRHSVESLYMEAHGWHLVTVDRKGRLHPAHTH